MSKKLTIEFITNNKPEDKVISNALMTQLMITIAQIGIRTNNPEQNIIKKEIPNE